MSKKKRKIFASAQRHVVEAPVAVIANVVEPVPAAESAPEKTAEPTKAAKPAKAPRAPRGSKPSPLEWKETDWNPITMHDGKLMIHPDAFGKNRRTIIPRIFHVSRECDLFGEGVPQEVAELVMMDIEESSRHRFVLVTENEKRMAKFFSNRPVPTNLSVWAQMYGAGDKPIAKGSVTAIAAQKLAQKINR